LIMSAGMALLRANNYLNKIDIKNAFQIFFPLPFIVILKVVMHLQIHSHFLGITRYNP
jgi:hypothetical protein